MINKLPVIINSNNIYFRMKGLSWICNEDFPETVVNDVAKIISIIIKQVENNSIIVINCKGIKEIEDNGLTGLSEIVKAKKICIIWFNYEQVRDEIVKYFKDVTYNQFITAPQQIYINGEENCDEVKALDLIKSFLEIEIQLIKNIVKNSYYGFPTDYRLPSTPIYSNGYFNAGNIISTPKSFISICLHLSEKLEVIFENKKLTQPRLIAASLYASPFVGAIAQLNKLEFEVIDHIGPKYKILEEHSLNYKSQDYEYIYIGDFVIAGTEIKIAQSYVRGKGAKLNHALVIGSLLNKSDYAEDIEVLSLVRLTELGLRLNYRLL